MRQLEPYPFPETPDFSPKTSFCPWRTLEVVTFFPDCKPFQGIAIDALLEKKHSQDNVLFTLLEVGTASLAWLQMQTLESPLAETMCRPSEVKDAET